ncbi:MAG: GDCCVxC domain-containing (seleno)protein [Balneolaceae bacterium]|nr:GDCCVxC domain-containing (seleno)protein [Balneolaceae bacterium]
MNNVSLTSTITCPECGHRSTEKMPTDSCRFFWECPRCDNLIKPQKGDCCVFCSYGDHPCPPVQKEGESCC